MSEDIRLRINDDIVLLDGIARCAVVMASGSGLSDTDDLRQCIKLVVASGESGADIWIGDISGQKRKVIVSLGKHYHIAIEAICSHPINKSLRRTLRRIESRYDNVIPIPAGEGRDGG